MKEQTTITKQKITILALTDLHTSGDGFYEKIASILTSEEIDFIIIAGDVTSYGNEKAVKKVLSSFTATSLPLYYVPGNMDKPQTADIEFANIHPLHARVKKIANYRLIGLGASNPTPFSTPFTLSEEQLTELLEETISSVPETAPLIFVSHAPPFNSEADKLRNGKHVGSKAVRKFVDTYQPIVTICGHIHESQSIAMVGKTLIVNPGEARTGFGAVITLTTQNNDRPVAKAKIIEF
jgi:hypothetical protein